MNSIRDSVRSNNPRYRFDIFGYNFCIPNTQLRSVRVFVIDDKVIAAMERTLFGWVLPSWHGTKDLRLAARYATLMLLVGQLLISTQQLQQLKLARNK